MAPAEELKRLALAAGFDLVGFAKAEPIPRSTLVDWLEAGHHADMDWMAERVEERLDPSLLLPGAKTVISLACNYWHSDEPSAVARYARGRDYHATMKDRIRAFRRAYKAAFPGVRDYGGVDAVTVMEKVWAVRAGIGTVTKNGCLTTQEFGSYVVLATVILDLEVDAYAGQMVGDQCGRCRICIDACPTGAIGEAAQVDANACLSYQTIENAAVVPEQWRGGLQGFLFGCDICQDVCPLNMTPVKGSARFEPRPLATRTVRQFAAMTREEYEQFVPGSPLARAGFDGLRRNAAYALGAVKDVGAREILIVLSGDPVEFVAEAARWALDQLKSASC